MKHHKAINLVKVLRPYPGKWVALLDTKVVGVGSTPKAALKKARACGVEEPILTKAPKKDGSYIL